MLLRMCKAAAREELRQRVGLTGCSDKPLVGVVSRLTAQKGAGLRRALTKLMAKNRRNNLNACIKKPCP